MTKPPPPLHTYFSQPSTPGGQPPLDKNSPLAWPEHIWHSRCDLCLTWHPDSQPHTCQNIPPIARQVLETAPIPLSATIPPSIAIPDDSPKQEIDTYWPKDITCQDCSQCYLPPSGHPTCSISPACAPSTGHMKILSWEELQSRNTPSQKPAKKKGEP